MSENGASMTTAWGKVVPLQRAMINLAGFDVMQYPGEEPPLSERVKRRVVKSGRVQLKGFTGEDFGFDLNKWHEHLLANHETSYCHPYGWSSVGRALELALNDPARDELANELERTPEKISTEKLAESLVDLLRACDKTVVFRKDHGLESENKLHKQPRLSRRCELRGGDHNELACVLAL